MIVIPPPPVLGGNLGGILSESHRTSDDLKWLYRASSDPR
jgi:hypothetical protein